MTLSNSDKKIICRELELKGIESIVLTGSRARCDGHKNSDYDLYVVVSTLLVPFIYIKLKKKEIILKNMLGSKVSIAPMTLKRIKCGNDLLLLKTKMQGMTLLGKNYLPEITINNIADVPADEIYSYLFSAAYLLIEKFNPYKSIDEKCIYNTAKAIMYCAEIQLMMEGALVIRRDDIICEITRLGLTDNLILIKHSKSILDGKFSIEYDPNYFWLSAKDYLMSVFLQMNKKYLNIDYDASKRIGFDLFSGMRSSCLKNLQFLALCLINKRPFNFSLITKNVEKHLWYSLLCLVMSVERDISIESGYLRDSNANLKNLGLNYATDLIDFSKAWYQAKNIIIDYWPMACAKSLF